MIKLFSCLCLIVLILSCASMDPKRMACEQACESSYGNCTEEAGDDAVKITACTVAKEKCLSECK